MPVAGKTQLGKKLARSFLTPDDLSLPFGKAGTDIFVIPRSVDFSLGSQIDEACLGEYRMRIEPAIAAPVVRDSLQSLNVESQSLVDDICESIRLFAKAFQQPRVDLRIEVADTQSCPKFHCDNVFVRMLTTYAGPATEYIYLDHPHSICQAPVNALVLLKGHRHPNHQEAVHHRSPEIPAGEKRLCVIYNCDQWLGTRAG
jgi:hypothetical protein